MYDILQKISKTFKYQVHTYPLHTVQTESARSSKSIFRRLRILVAVVTVLHTLNSAGQVSKDSVATETDVNVIFLSDTTALPLSLQPDSLSSYALHSPAKASIMSAVVPGLGQVYNRKYWKIPIVYAAIGFSVERFIKYQNLYNQFRRAYIDMNDNDPYTNFQETLLAGFSNERKAQVVNKFRETYRTYRDWAIVAVAATYAMNIIDANVDAHLMDFNLDDNISLNIRPYFLRKDIYSQKIGLTLRLTF